MKPRDIALALLVTFLWGTNFMISKFGLFTTPPLLLGLLRFLGAGAFAFFLPRPKVALSYLFLVSLFLFVTQFSLVFTSINMGMPTSLISLVLQAQAFFTIVYISILKRKFPNRQIILGSVIALCGLWIIFHSVKGDHSVTVMELVLALGAAASWAFGNILVARLGKIDMLATVAWVSILSIPGFAVLTFVIEGPALIMSSLANFDTLTGFCVFYLSVISTIVAYGLWNFLISKYGAGVVAPFSLLVPVTGIAMGTLFLGEALSTEAIWGTVFIIAGLITLNINKSLLKFK